MNAQRAMVTGKQRVQLRPRTGTHRMNLNMAKPTSMTEQSDDELLQQISIHKNHEAFEVFVKRHQRSAFSLAIRLTGKHNLAEDAFQETCLRVWRFASSWRAESSARSWMLRIVARESLRIMRRKQGNMSMSEDTLNSISAPGNIPEEPVDRTELIVALRASLGQIPSRQRQIIALYYGAGLDQREIGVELKISKQVVSYNIRQTIMKLRTLLTNVGFAVTVSALEKGALEKALCSGFQPPVEWLPRVLENVCSQLQGETEPSSGTLAKDPGTRTSLLWVVALALTLALGLTGYLYVSPFEDSPASPSSQSDAPVAARNVSEAPVEPIQFLWDFKKNDFTGMTKVNGELNWIPSEDGQRGGVQMHQREPVAWMLPVISVNVAYRISMDWRNTKFGEGICVGCGWTDGTSTVLKRNYMKENFDILKLNKPYRAVWIFVDGFMMLMDQGSLKQLTEFKLPDRPLRLHLKGHLITLDRLEVQSLNQSETNVWRKHLNEVLKSKPSSGS